MVQTINKSGQKSIKIKGEANVVFVIDVTGSMGDCLENLKNNIIDLAGTVVKECKDVYGITSPDISYNAIGFRDLEKDLEDQIVKMGDSFTPDVDELKLFFDKVEMKAAGGDDDEESALDAIYIALKDLKWDKKAKVLILFTDAGTKPLHTSTTNGVTMDMDRSVDIVIQELNSTRVVIFGPENSKEYTKIGSKDKCLYKGLKKVGETLKDFSDDELFKKNIVKLIAATVSKATSETKGWKKP